MATCQESHYPCPTISEYMRYLRPTCSTVKLKFTTSPFILCKTSNLMQFAEYTADPWRASLRNYVYLGGRLCTASLASLRGSPSEHSSKHSRQGRQAWVPTLGNQIKWTLSILYGDILPSALPPSLIRPVGYIDLNLNQWQLIGSDRVTCSSSITVSDLLILILCLSPL